MPRSDPLANDAPQAAHERQRRAVAIALVLAGLVVLFYVMTIVRVHP